MTTTFDAYIIAVPHRDPAYIIADNRYDDSNVADTLAEDERLNDLSRYVVIESVEDEDRELAHKDGNQASTVGALINNMREDRYKHPITLSGHRVVDAAAIPTSAGRGSKCQNELERIHGLD